MIKINLLAEGRRPVVARKIKPKLSLGGLDPSLVILAAGVLVGLLAAAGWWYLVAADLDEIQGQVARAQREVEELRPIIEEVEAFKLKQADLTKKINVIKDLKAKQTGPVHIMDEISRALPDLLWLSNMRMQGDLVSLRGSAFNTNAIAALIENLNRVPEFKEPDTESIAQEGRGDLYSFAVNFRFSPHKPPEAAAGTAAPAEAGASPPTGG
jgi:type IV pilus assembly protein PilN